MHYCALKVRSCQWFVNSFANIINGCLFFYTHIFHRAYPMTLDQAGMIQRLMPGRQEPEETIKIKGVNPDPELVLVLHCLQSLVCTLFFKRHCHFNQILSEEKNFERIPQSSGFSKHHMASAIVLQKSFFFLQPTLDITTR